MTIKEFAKRTGYHSAYIAKACRHNKIPCGVDYSGHYDISPKWVPVWRWKRRIDLHSKDITKSVRAYQNALDAYNKANGTDYSYGQAVRYNIPLEV